MVKGVGVDIVNCRRIGDNISRWGDKFLQRIFTEKEIRYCSGRRDYPLHFAGRFAAKEALVKALRRRGGIKWKEIEIGERGNIPEIKLRGGAKEIARRQGVEELWVSISHEGEYAVAIVVAEGGMSEGGGEKS